MRSKSEATSLPMKLLDEDAMMMMMRRKRRKEGWGRSGKEGSDERMMKELQKGQSTTKLLLRLSLSEEVRDGDAVGTRMSGSVQEMDEESMEERGRQPRG